MTLLERQAWAALISVPGIGPHTFKWLRQQLLKYRYSIVDFWYHWPEMSQQLSLKLKHQGGLRVFQREYTLESYWQYLVERQIQIVTDEDVTYPKLLQQCEDRPPVLFIKGQFDFWNQTPIAVVGTRKVTSYGQLVTEKITTELVKSAPVTIVSGFMYGVDAIAHQAAVAAGGKTIGVLGFGFDYLYPAHHQNLIDELLERGNCLITELAPGVPPTAGTFPARNRIIAGLSLAVLVTEAAEQSGSHITATYALEYGRLVAAVPGPITNHFSEGTKKLVKEGALMISSGAELLSELGVPIVQRSGPDLTTVTPTQAKLLKALSSQPSTLDELCRLMHWSLPQLSEVLLDLELSNLVKKIGDRWVVA